MELNFRWVDKKAQYQTGKTLYLNAIAVASYDWNCFLSKSDTNKEDKRYRGVINLPSLKDNMRYGSTDEMVMSKIELTVRNWFKEATK